MTVCHKTAESLAGASFGRVLAIMLAFSPRLFSDEMREIVLRMDRIV